MKASIIWQNNNELFDLRWTMWEGRYDTRYNDTKHNDTQDNKLICDIQWHSEHEICVVMLKVRFLSVMLSVIIVNRVMLSVIMLNVIMLGVVAP